MANLSNKEYEVRAGWGGEETLPAKEFIKKFQDRYNELEEKAVISVYENKLDNLGGE